MALGFDDGLAMVLFMVAIWVSGRLLELVHVSPLLGWIVMGTALGPNGLDYLPFAKPDEKGINVYSLIGQVGVALMIMESGLHIKFHKMLLIGWRSFLVALVGTFFPLLIGMCVFFIFGYPLYPDAVCGGIALAPTSVGIAMRMLVEHKQLTSNVGQTIMTAGFMDDVLSLLALIIILASAEGELNINSILAPLAYACLLIVFGVIIGIRFAKRWVNRLAGLPCFKVQEKKSFQPKDELLLMLMLGTLLLIGWLSHFIGSHLLGAFVTGILYSQVPRSMMVWQRQMKRIAKWLVRVFFACTVAFSIPVQEILSVNAFWKGLIIGLVAIVAKLFCGTMGFKGTRWLVASAMVGRGEFAFLVAELAQNTVNRSTGLKMMSKEVFAIIVWALVIAINVCPFLFNFVLRRYMANKLKSGIVAFEIQISGHHHVGVLRQVCNTLNGEALEVVQAHMESDGEVDNELFVVKSRGFTDFDWDEDKEFYIVHILKESIRDEKAVIVIRPLSKEEFQEDLGVEDEKFSGRNPSKTDEDDGTDELGEDVGIVIKLMTHHHPDVFHDITECLNSMGLHIQSSSAEDLGHDTDLEVFHVKGANTRLTRHHRTAIRTELMEIFKKNQIKGEIMVKLEHGFDVELEAQEHMGLSKNRSRGRNSVPGGLKNTNIKGGIGGRGALNLLKDGTSCLLVVFEGFSWEVVSITEAFRTLSLDVLSCVTSNSKGMHRMQFCVGDKKATAKDTDRLVHGLTILLEEMKGPDDTFQVISGAMSSTNKPKQLLDENGSPVMETDDNQGELKPLQLEQQHEHNVSNMRTVDEFKSTPKNTPLKVQSGPQKDFLALDIKETKTTSSASKPKQTRLGLNDDSSDPGSSDEAKHADDTAATANTPLLGDKTTASDTPESTPTKGVDTSALAELAKKKLSPTGNDLAESKENETAKNEQDKKSPKKVGAYTRALLGSNTETELTPMNKEKETAEKNEAMSKSPTANVKKPWITL